MSNFANKKFIDNIIIPYYKILNMRGQNFVITAKDTKIITASDSHARYYGLNNHFEVLQKTFKQLYPYYNKHPKLFNEITRIQESIISNELSIDYLICTESAQGFIVEITHSAPLFNEDGDVIGTVETFTNLKDYLAINNTTFSNLNQRQAEILFLLAIGASQKEIAAFYKTSYGTIAKEIYRICNKLNIDGASEKILIDKAIKEGYAIVPTHLFKPNIPMPISNIYNKHIVHFLTNNLIIV